MTPELASRLFPISLSLLIEGWVRMEANRPFPLASRIVGREAAISRGPVWAVVVALRNVCKPTVARGDKGRRCVMRGTICLPEWLLPLVNC